MNPGFTYTTSTTEDEMTFTQLEEAMKLQKKILEKELKEKEERIKRGELKIDTRGNEIPQPTAVVQEKIIRNRTTNGNEEMCEDIVELEIVDQQYNFYFVMYANDDGTTSPYDGQYYVKLSSDGCFEQWTSKQEFKFFFKGSSDRNSTERKAFSVPLKDYECFIKRCFLESGVQIMEDEKAKEFVEAETEKNVSYIFREKPTKQDIDEMIKLVDVKKFTNIIRARLIKDNKITGIESLTDEWAKNYLLTWAKNKFKFYKLFGNKLTLEIDVDVKPDNNEMMRKWQEIREQFPLLEPIFNQIGDSTIIENNVRRPGDYAIWRGFFKDTRVKENMSFTKFISLFENQKLEMEVSKLYQEKGKGHLVISINPIDYLTVSINASQWDSCHHFMKGAYRNAGLSYMNDKTSLVSYRSDREVKYEFEGKKFEWNTKCWRQMIYVAEQNSTMVFSRQYPYESEELSFHIRQLLENAVATYYGGQNKWKIFNKKNQANIKVEKGNKARLYNDVGCGFNHKVVRAKDDKSERKDITIRIGTEVIGVISKESIRNENCSIW